MEMHTVIGAGAAEGAMDAGILANGGIASDRRDNHRRYRKYIEKARLDRRFQPIMVEEPSVEDTISILRGLKSKYEVHCVRITDSAAIAAATLSSRYIADRQLPDKAIDLIDGLPRIYVMEIDQTQALDEVDRDIMQLK